MMPRLFEIETAEQAVDYVMSFTATDAPRRVLLVGNPDACTTMFVRRLRPQLGPLDDDDLEQVAWVRYGSRLCDDAEQCYDRARPFRAPHHTLSYAAMFGALGRPGEVSLAHGGVLLLDDVTEFRGSVVADLLDEVPVEVTRSPKNEVLAEPVPLPASPRLLVATTNPCPCGWLGGARACSCHPGRILNYIARQHRTRFDHVVRFKLGYGTPASRRRSGPPHLEPLARLPIHR
jgi:magnesium chelatase family protein